MDYNYITIGSQQFKVGVYSPYQSNINSQIIEYQKKVFDKFDIKLNQILTSITNSKTHGTFLTEISTNEDVDYIVFFDIDAIPLKKDFLQISLNRILNKRAILGIEQFANHAKNSEIYAGPACFLISKKTYVEMNFPTYETNDCGGYDCGQYLSILAKKKNVEINFFKFKECVIPRWRLDNKRRFGIGSTYEDLVFHNFESRDHKSGSLESDIFINKCKEILDN